MDWSNERYVRIFERLLESPLERKLLDAFIAEATSCDLVTQGACPPYLVMRFGATSFALWPQVQWGKYRVDFAVCSNRERWFAIEVDGHPWHERSKEQAARDRRRDRFLLRAGTPTLRFTGREVHQKPDLCVREVVSVLEHGDVG